jgi:DNA-directed RNA polymerase specialized sigma subunit
MTSKDAQLSERVIVTRKSAHSLSRKDKTMTREDLKEVRKLNKEIESMKRSRERLFYSVLGTSTKMDDVRVQSSGSGDRFGDTIAGVADLDKKILDSINRLYKLQGRALDWIQALKHSEQRTVLIEYYINGSSWDEVAEVSGYSVQHVFKIHNEALKEIEE